MAGIAVALGYYWPALTAGWPRGLFLIALTVGARPGSTCAASARARSSSTRSPSASSLPLAIFIVVGLLHPAGPISRTLPPITLQQVATAALLLIFVYGGYDVVPVPAGEALDPRRDVPFALVATILIVMTS